jgi:tRNA dimethylallyltransferase
MRSLAQESGNLAVYRLLQQRDPATAQRLHPNDLLRVIRALEVFELTGQPISVQQATATAPAAQYASCFLVLSDRRDRLYCRINLRVDEMIQRGLVGEVQSLLRRGYHRGLNPMNSLGYKEIGAYLAGHTDLGSAITLIKRNTRRYAKRQLTWLRKYETPRWILHETEHTLEDTVGTCLHAISEWRKQEA